MSADARRQEQSVIDAQKEVERANALLRKQQDETAREAALHDEVVHLLIQRIARLVQDNEALQDQITTLQKVIGKLEH